MRAVVRKIDVRSQSLQKIGAEIVVADMYDYEQMTAALKGTKRAYFCPPVQPFMIHAATVFAVAAREASLEYIAGLSQWLASPQHPSLHTRQLWLVENLFSTIPGVRSTVVNPGAFADTFLQPLPTAAQLGVYPNAFGSHKNAPPSNEDIAKVIVGCLMDPDTHAGKRYRPTGPQLLSIHDMVATIGRVVGRDLNVQDVPLNVFFKVARASGFSEFEITSTQHYIADGRLNAFELHAPTTDVFEVSDEPVETFEETAKRYAATMPGVSRTQANKIKAIGETIKMLATRPCDLEPYEETQGRPKVSTPELASHSARWLDEHRANKGWSSLDFVGALKME